VNIGELLYGSVALPCQVSPLFRAQCFEHIFQIQILLLSQSSLADIQGICITFEIQRKLEVGRLASHHVYKSTLVGVAILCAGALIDKHLLVVVETGVFAKLWLVVWATFLRCFISFHLSVHGQWETVHVPITPIIW